MGKDRLPLHMRLGETFHIRIYEDDDDDFAMEFPPQDFLPPEMDLIEFSSDEDTSDDEYEGSVNYPMSMLDGIETDYEEPQLIPTPGDPEDILNNPPGSVTEPVAGPSTNATPGQNQETPVAIWDVQQLVASNNDGVVVLAELRAAMAQLRVNLDMADATFTRIENTNLNPPE